MSRALTESKEGSHAALITGGCALIALLGMLVPSPQPPPPPTASAPPPPAEAVEKPVVATWESSPENRVTFAKTMPRMQGTQIFNNTGQPNLSQVMVAIPTGPKTVRFVRGNDPAAVRYLARTTAAQKRILLDKGPATVDTSEISDFGPLKGRGTRHARNLAATDAPTPPPPAAVPPGQ